MLEMHLTVQEDRAEAAARLREAGTSGFAELHTGDTTTVLVNPAAVAYIEVLGDKHGTRPESGGRGSGGIAITAA